MRAINIEIKLMKLIRELAELPHNVIKIDGYCDFLENNPVYYYRSIVLPYYENSSLDKYLNSHRIPLVERLEFMHGIASGIKQLHQNQIAHGDLAARNVLVSDQLEPIL